MRWIYNFIFSLVLLFFVCSCAGTVKVDRSAFMKRAQEFDTRYPAPKSELYRTCYQGYVEYLYRNCKSLADKYEGTDEVWKFWTCADDALDKMEECMEKDNG